MVEITTDLILLQCDLLINLATTTTVGTHMNGHHVYKEIWTPKHNEYQDIRCEPENPVDIYAVRIKNWKDVVGHLKKGDTGCLDKTIFYFRRSHLDE